MAEHGAIRIQNAKSPEAKAQKMNIFSESYEMKKLRHTGPRKRRPKKKKNTNLTNRVNEHVLRANAKPFYPAPCDIQDERLHEEQDRAFWARWAISAAETERARRLGVLSAIKQEEEEEIRKRRQWAMNAVNEEQQNIKEQYFLNTTIDSQWFQSMLSMLEMPSDYEIMCPNSWFGCTFSCMRKDIESHFKVCLYCQVPDILENMLGTTGNHAMDLLSYDVVCPNAVLGCTEICSRNEVAQHLAISCPISGAASREKEWEERKQYHENVILATEQERIRRIQEQAQRVDWRQQQVHQLYESQMKQLQSALHEEIVGFVQECTLHANKIRNLITEAIEYMRLMICRCWQDQIVSCDVCDRASYKSLQPQVEPYGSYVTKLYGSYSDVDLVVFHVTSEKESSQQCVQKLAKYLSDNYRSVVSLLELASFSVEEISEISRAAFPLLKVTLRQMQQEGTMDAVQNVIVHLDITFDDPLLYEHNGIASAALVSCLAEHFLGLRELSIVLKHFLAMRQLNDPSVGGLSSYGLFLMIVYVQQLHPQEHVLETSAATDKDLGPLSCSKVTLQQQKGISTAIAILGQSFAASDGPLSKKWLSQVSPVNELAKGKTVCLGKLLMDFLYYYGTEFRLHVDEINVLDLCENAITSESCMNRPMSKAFNTASYSPIATTPIPQSNGNILRIRDPLQPINNVGKACYRVSQLLRNLSESLSTLTTLAIRSQLLPAHRNCYGQLSQDTDMQSHPILNSLFRNADAPVGGESSAH